MLVDADCEAPRDFEEREALMQIPTSWALEATTVTRVRRAAKTLLAESASFQALLRSLYARPMPLRVPAEP